MLAVLAALCATPATAGCGGGEDETADAPASFYGVAPEGLESPADYARMLDDRAGQMVVFFVLAVAAAEAAVGLALFIAIFRLRRTIDLNRINLLRW